MFKLEFDVVLDLYSIVCLASLSTSHDHHTFHSTRKIDVTHKIIRTYVCTKQTYYALCRVVGNATMVLWYSFFLSLLHWLVIKGRESGKYQAMQKRRRKYKIHIGSLLSLLTSVVVVAWHKNGTMVWSSSLSPKPAFG